MISTDACPAFSLTPTENPRLDLLRGDVRFVDLLRRVRLSPQPAS
jgi:hypothetical protein